MSLGPIGWLGVYFGRIALSPSDSGDQLALFLLGEAEAIGWGPPRSIPASLIHSSSPDILSHFLSRGELPDGQIFGSWGKEWKLKLKVGHVHR